MSDEASADATPTGTDRIGDEATADATPTGTGRIDDEAFDALAELYHRYLTGLVLALVTNHGEDRTVDALFGLFRRQHLEKFLPGLAKLGLTDEPHAVACAKYHYLSNHLGGVSVVYVPQSDRKAWVRYLPPRWIFDGTALAAVPTRAARAMLWGWHAHNGVSLGNPRLGFVCTGQTMDGNPGLEGYYVEEDRELEPDERLRFRFGEACPPVDHDALPTLAADTWPPERLAKVSRNYAMDYLRNLIPVLTEQLGPLDARALLYATGRRIGMQYASIVPVEPGGVGATLTRMLASHGDRVTLEDGGTRIEQRSWRLMRGLEAECVPEWFDGWRGMWEGVAAVHDRDVALTVRDRLDRGDDAFSWQVVRRGTPANF